MGRPRLHDFPADAMLRGIASVIRGRREALEADLTAAQAELAAERKASAKSEADRVAAGLDYAEWGKLHPTWKTGDGWHREQAAKQALAHLAAHGVAYDLEAFTGRNDLTASARVVAGKVIRDLEAAGLVKIEGARAVGINVTPAGLAAIAADARTERRDLAIPAVEAANG